MLFIAAFWQTVCKVRNNVQTWMSAALLGLAILFTGSSQARAERLIVSYKAQGSSISLRAQTHTNGLVPLRILSDHHTVIARVGSQNIASLIRTLRRDPRVRFVEADRRVRMLASSNDPLWGSLWGMSKIGVGAAWSAATPTATPLVAVIDSGTTMNHPDLQNMLWTNPGEIPGNGIDDDRDGIIDDVHGADFSDYDGNPTDSNGHGTHVSGTIAGQSGNGIGVAGVATQVKIMSVRFLDARGSGYLGDAVSAIDYATQHGAKIMNNSWGGGGYSQALADAISRAQKAGALFVAAAGNEGNNNDANPSYPASYTQDNVLAVAATDANDNLASFSNYGTANVDMGAPGVSILSTWLGGGYSSLSGTSMATPHVSGAAAWLWSVRPQASAEQIKAALVKGGQTVSALATKTLSGKRLYLPEALAYLDGLLGSSNPNPTPSPNPSGPRNTTPPVIQLGYTTAACSVGTWIPVPRRYSFSWYSNGVKIGAGSSSYSIENYDFSKPLTCSATAYLPDGSSATAWSAPLTVPAPRIISLPKLSGGINVGNKLVCGNGNWLYGPLAFQYSWYRNGSQLAGETANAHYVMTQDQGQILSCSVVATNSTNSSTAYSNIMLVPRPLTRRW